MRIILVDDLERPPTVFPAIALRPDPWDDYGYKTTFFATLWTAKGRSHPLHKVKIIKAGMAPGTLILRKKYANGLPDDFASLGADFIYYERLADLGSIGADALNAMKDIAINPARGARFENDHAYKVSLLRLAPAKDAFRRVRSLFPIEPAEAAVRTAAPVPSAEDVLGSVQTGKSAGRAPIIEPLQLEFTPPPSDVKLLRPGTIQFDFAGPDGLPGNLVALVGPNGTGKTTLLSDLAQAIFFGEREPGEDPVGDVRILRGAARDVLFVSYSAYDSFRIPETQQVDGDARLQLSSQGYTYIGLRKLSSGEVADRDNRERRITLKSIAEIDAEFDETLSGIEGDAAPLAGTVETRLGYFVAAIKTLFDDPSVAAITPLPKRSSPARIVVFVRKIFPTLSTGHKAILNIIVSLCRHLKQNSLVMMDEPESHLHPPLIATLLTITRDLLSKFDANAIVATHSPVVVQETLGEHVILLLRNDRHTSWKLSPTQTYGENIGALTNRTFGLPAAKADFIGRLEQLVRNGLTLEEIEARFGTLRMSSPARAQALRIIAQFQAGLKR